MTIWPTVMRNNLKTGADRELVACYPYRSAVPRTLWVTQPTAPFPPAPELVPFVDAPPATAVQLTIAAITTAVRATATGPARHTGRAVGGDASNRAPHTTPNRRSFYGR